ncbi:MAG TPA: polysaccharide deacetylase family protein [Alphaproteobacteria bacterium]|nr:polysaccharide deacetylase family protein [Alphaproteobacteria bacterium]
MADKLTILLFHRVIPDEMAKNSKFDPEYTLALSLFRASVSLLARQYSVISLRELFAWIDGGPELPTRPLLITFDDGWSDTAQYAAPVLNSLRLPAVAFVASDAIADVTPTWWQDAVRAEGTQAGRSFHERLVEVARDPAARNALLARTAPDEPGVRQMMGAKELGNLPSMGIAIGAHSAGHLPLTLLADDEINADLARARHALSDWLDPAAAAVASRCLAFPHGRYDARVIALARSAGFDLLFTSDPCLNRLIRQPPYLFGRIALSTAAIAGPDGSLAPDRLATWLLARPALKLAQPKPP